MRVRPKLIIYVCVAFFLISLQAATAATNKEERVEFVEVQLSIGGKIYEGLQERIEFSIARVGEKILLSQPVALLTTNKETVKMAITNVFSKVLTGFKLESVELFLGEHTKIIIHLTPIPPLISEFQVNLEVQTINPEINHVTSEVSLRVEEELNRIFTGLPVSVVAWSEGIFNSVIDYLLEREFPGFSARFLLQAGVTTQLNLVLTPQEPLVSAVGINYTTSNIPGWFVKVNTREYQSRLNILKGLPVEFLIHYRPRLEKYVTEYLNNFDELQQLGLAVKLGITPGVKTRVSLAVDSQRYQTRLEGRCFVNNDQFFGNVQLYLGYHTPDFEVFTRYYWGDRLLKAGFGFPINDNFTGGFEYEFNNDYKQVWFHYQLERGDYLDLKLGVDGSPNEAVIGVYLNKYTNLELVNYAKDLGLQVMFHF